MGQVVPPPGGSTVRGAERWMCQMGGGKYLQRFTNFVFLIKYKKIEKIVILLKFIISLKGCHFGYSSRRRRPKLRHCPSKNQWSVYISLAWNEATAEQDSCLVQSAYLKWTLRLCAINCNWMGFSDKSAIILVATGFGIACPKTGLRLCCTRRHKQIKFL